MTQARPYQTDMIARINAAWDAGDRDVLGVLPTGAGKTFYTYILRDPRCLTPFYVGKGTGWRMVRHVRGQAHSQAVKNKIAKLAREGTEVLCERIDALDEQHAFFLEQCLIELFGRRDLGSGTLLNLTDGGEGMSGWRPTEATRAKLVENRNRPEMKEIMRSAHLGAKRSPETRAKIAAKAIGRKISDETRAKLSESRRGKKRTDPEYLAKLSERAKASHAAKPRKHSEETKQKMRESQKARRVREGWHE